MSHDPGAGPDPALVAAARDGDPQAVERLLSESLPLVYNIVGRALDGHSDVDDVVQETLLRVMRGLGRLEQPESYRSWMVAITVRRIRDWIRARQRTRDNLRPLPQAEHLPDASDFVSLTILRLNLADQRREVAEATRWLDEDDRELLSLWWLEETGRLERAELAGALGLSERHAAMRVRRLKDQLDVSRGVVRALAAEPACPELGGITGGWDGRPSPLWRKRLARHVRGCSRCDGGPDRRAPVEGLLRGLPLLAPPPALYQAVAEALRSGFPGAADDGPAGGGGPGDAGGTGQAGDAGQTAEPTADARAGPSPQRGIRAPGHRRVYPSAARRSVLAAAGAGAVATGVLVAVAVADGTPAQSAAPAPRPAAQESSAAPGSPAPSPSATPAPSRSAPPPSLSAPATAETTEPAETTATGGKGVAVWEFGGAGEALQLSGAGWYYTWSTDRLGVSAASGAEFVPMIWGADSVTDQALAEAEAAGDHLLGFNEPDMAAQADMSVEQALKLWPRLEETGSRLGSPSVAYGADAEGGWLDRFMAGADQRGYRVDFITVHWYGADFRTGPAVEQLRGYLGKVHEKYGKPVWLTEYALIDFSAGTPRYPAPAEQAAFVTASAEMLSELPFVQRYAWFGLGTDEGGATTALYRSGPTPTEVGHAFRAAP
ncbi:hypothetical protein GCM10027570_22000 [Streptomonospora sediminis]